MTTTEQTHVTGYQLAQLANFKLEAEGMVLDDETNPPLAPQMVYSYIASGKIPAEEIMVLGKQKTLVKNEVAWEWIRNYVANRLKGTGRGAKVDPEAWFAARDAADESEEPTEITETSDEPDAEEEADGEEEAPEEETADEPNADDEPEAKTAPDYEATGESA